MNFVIISFFKWFILVIRIINIMRTKLIINIDIYNYCCYYYSLKCIAMIYVCLNHVLPDLTLPFFQRTANMRVRSSSSECSKLFVCSNIEFWMCCEILWYSCGYSVLGRRCETEKFLVLTELTAGVSCGLCCWFYYGCLACVGITLRNRSFSIFMLYNLP